jgi:hypothetical protein
MRSKDQLARSGRRADRLPVEAETRLKPNSWSSVAAEVRDLSAEGFRAQCPARVQPGSGVTLEIAGIGEVEAQVEWRRGDEFGARFVVPIDLDRCEWTLQDRHQTLARLLVQRAQAQQVGRGGAELQLRREILSGLPMRRGCAPA